MYKFAYSEKDHVVFYDAYGNKYVARGGNLAWRINNPGLISSRSRFSKKNSSIGSCEPFAIFSTPEHGFQALRDWLHSKENVNAPADYLIKQYQKHHLEVDFTQFVILHNLPLDKKISAFSEPEMECLLQTIIKICRYRTLDNERLTLIPKIIAKIENGKDKDDSYLSENNIVLSKTEAMEWVLSDRLDAVIVHEQNGKVYLRSRPTHSIRNFRMPVHAISQIYGQIETLVRIIGEKKPGQCIWGFINGISNSKEEALESSRLISVVASGEAVISMKNDTTWGGIKDFIASLTLKAGIDTPLVSMATKFFRYLLALSDQDDNDPPVIIFAHSQGAVISDHALDLLSEPERQKIRIFTFGGGSFIPPGKSHPDSHNYASAADYVSRLGSPNLQLLALENYYGSKEGISREQVIHRLAMRDVLLDIDSSDHKAVEVYKNQRANHYVLEFAKISNVTILDPDSDELWKHRFNSECYQATIYQIIKRYQANPIGCTKNEQMLCTV